MQKAFFTALSLLAGCTTVSSENIKTAGLSAQVEVATDPTSAGPAKLKVTFRNGSNYVQLTGNDSVRCEDKGLTLTSVLGVSSYSTTVPRKKDGEAYTCVVFRGNESITLSVPQVATLVIQGTTPSVWSKSDATIGVGLGAPKSGMSQRAVLIGNCIASGSTGDTASIDSNGLATFSRSSLSFNGLKDGESCKVRLTLSNTGKSSPQTSFEKAELISSDSVSTDLEIQR
jgi:hypothetical protein